VPEAILGEQQQADWWLFLTANPIGVDLGTPRLERAGPLRDLPENLRALLWDEKTSAYIYLLGRELNLRDDHISEIARTIRKIVAGEMSAAELAHVLNKKADIPPPQAQRAAASLTKKFIAPNYFQIAQVYEKKHRILPASPAGAAPPRVVDLRGTGTTRPPGEP
jgi:hypothetical protein